MENIEIKNLSKSFEGRKVIDGLSLTIPLQSRTAFMGRSGIGKTTLLNIMAGLTEPDEGTVTGVPLKKAAVFQEDRLCEDFTALANVKLVSESTDCREIFHRLLIPDAADKEVRVLSGGMKRRVAIARAVMSDADIIFLDEPFKGLDGDSKKAAAGVLLDTGKTIIMVTHDKSEAELMGAEIVELK